MSDILVIKVNMFCRSRELNDIRRYILCCDCQYCGDKYSFPLPNDLIEVDSENPFIKHYYCCCGDSEFYGKDITNLGFTKCDSFEEL